MSTNSNTILNRDFFFLPTLVFIMSIDYNIILDRDEPNNPLIMINVNSVVKLTASNYLLRKIELQALLVGYDLHYFVNTKGSIPISEYMQKINCIIDEFVILETVVPQEDVTNKIIDGLDSRSI